MSTLTVGSAVAVTTPQEEMLQKMFGLAPTYGRGEILGFVNPVPEELLSGDAESDAAIEAYVIQPCDGDGSPASNVEPDTAFIIARHPLAQEPVMHETLGLLPSAILIKQISKSEFIASLETRIDATVDQFRAELSYDLNLLASAADDDDKPEFLD